MVIRRDHIEWWKSGGLIGALSLNRGQTLLRDGVSSAHVSGTYDVGGILGVLNANGGVLSLLMDRLQTTGVITATEGGGLIGAAQIYNGSSVTLRNSYSTAEVGGGNGHHGGLAASIYTHGGTFDILSSYAAGPLTAQNQNAMGGLFGTLTSYSGTTRVLSSFWDSEATECPMSLHGWGSGDIDVDDAHALSTAEAKDPFTFINAGWDFDSVWGKSISGEE